MALEVVVARLVVVVTTLLIATAVWLVGVESLLAALRQWRPRLRTAAPYLAALAAVIVVRRLVRQVGPWLSWQIGWNITGRIYALEGTLVETIQSLATPPLTEYFVFVYIYGYVFLLTFPLVAYFALDRMDRLSELLLAYALNYGVGTVLYVLFIAYGPRNLLPGVIDGLLYTTYPQARLLTDAINRNVNAFPSLHASMSVTALLLAWRSRDAYPHWLPVAAVLSVSVVVSTMYLGIHWVADVLAGVALAVGCTYLAVRHVDTRRDAMGAPVDLRTSETEPPSDGEPR